MQPGPPERERRWVRVLTAALLLAAVCSCATGGGGPIDLMRQVPPTHLRFKAEPLEPMLVELETDTRPLEEHGNRKYLGVSHLRENALVEPTSVVLLRALARGLMRSGACRHASLKDAGQPYRLQVGLRRGTAAYEGGLEDLLFVLPTSGVEARVVMHLVLEDRSGRRMLDRVVRAGMTRRSAPASGLEQEAARALGAAIAKAVDRALPAIHAAPARYWERLRREGAPLSRPASRSSTDR